MSEVIIQCPTCSAKLKVNPSASRQVRCPKCSQLLSLSAPSPPPAQKPTPRPAPPPIQPVAPRSIPPRSIPPTSSPPQPINNPWNKQAKRKKAGVNPLIIVGAIAGGILIIGALAFFLLIGIKPAQVSSIEGMGPGSSQNSTASNRLKAATSGAEVQPLPPRRITPTPRKAVERRQAVLDDAVDLFGEIEDLGYSLPKNDESQANADRLLTFLPKVEKLLVRACRLAPVPVSYQQAQQSLDLNGSRSRRSSNRPVDPDNFFWSLKIGNQRDKPVTAAVNRLTSLRASIYNQLGSGLMELPSPYSEEVKQVDWNDEDRRQLEILRASGQYCRDFAFTLAPVNPQSPTENDLALLHQVIDKYVVRAKEIKGLSGKSNIIAEVPKRTVFQKQKAAAFVAVLGLQSQLLDIPQEHDRGEPNPELKWITEEFDRTREIFEDLRFHSGKRTPIPQFSSYERYGAMLEAQRQEAIAQAQEAEEQKIRQEQERLANIEKQRQEEERRKQIAEENRQREEKRQAALRERQQAFNNRGNGPPFGPGGRLGPRGGFGPRGRPDGFNPPPGFTPPTPRQFPGSQNEPDRDTSNDVTIQIKDAKNLDTRSIAGEIPKWLTEYGVSVQQTNGKLKITIKNFDQPLNKIQSGFPKLSFDSIDNETRTIVATEVVD